MDRSLRMRTRTSLAILALSTCLGSLAAAGPVAAQQTWPLPGLTCQIDYTLHADPAGSSVQGSGSCLKPDLSVVPVEINGPHSAGATFAPGMTFDVTSGAELLLDDLAWNRATVLPVLRDTTMPLPNVSLGAVRSLVTPGQGLAASISSIHWSTTPHSGIYNESGNLVLTFVS